MVHCQILKEAFDRKIQHSTSFTLSLPYYYYCTRLMCTCMSEAPDRVGGLGVQSFFRYGRGVQREPHLPLVHVDHLLRYDDLAPVQFRSTLEAEQRHQAALHLFERFRRHLQLLGLRPVDLRDG